jgi:excisionase family DNA binding protein
MGGIGMSVTNTVMNQPQKLLKAVEVADILSISRAFTYQLMKQGKIRTVEIGSARRVRPEDLQEFIAESIVTYSDSYSSVK